MAFTTAQRRKALEKKWKKAQQKQQKLQRKLQLSGKTAAQARRLAGAAKGRLPGRPPKATPWLVSEVRGFFTTHPDATTAFAFARLKKKLKVSLRTFKSVVARDLWIGPKPEKPDVSKDLEERRRWFKEAKRKGAAFWRTAIWIDAHELKKMSTPSAQSAYSAHQRRKFRRPRCDKTGRPKKSNVRAPKRKYIPNFGTPLKHCIAVNPVTGRTAMFEVKKGTWDGRKAVEMVKWIAREFPHAKTVILDNDPSHRTKLCLDAARDCGLKLHFQSSNSPDQSLLDFYANKALDDKVFNYYKGKGLKYLTTKSFLKTVGRLIAHQSWKAGVRSAFAGWKRRLPRVIKDPSIVL